MKRTRKIAELSKSKKNNLFTVNLENYFIPEKAYVFKRKAKLMCVIFIKILTYRYFCYFHGIFHIEIWVVYLRQISSLTEEKADLLTKIANLTEELTHATQRLSTNDTDQDLSPVGVEATSTPDNSQAAIDNHDNKCNDSGLGLSESLQNGPRLAPTDENCVDDEKNDVIPAQVRWQGVLNT